MTAIKTAISMESKLLERVDKLAGELEIPRSRLLARAAEELLTRHENLQLLERLNEVHGTETAAHEEQREIRRRLRPQFRRRLEGQW